ncbi:MAG: type VI secretion system-associated FHA domain protein TagH [Gammaproteobacteria bacterium]|nr:type VI secretion system-associated FHA domain protein TagH [Gammaproteobacteria bacterium]
MPLRLRVTSDSKELPRDQRVQEFPAVGGTIGRSPDNDWVLPDEQRYVSSRHAMIEYQGGAYYLVDTSRNGVYVNGADTPVGQGHPQRLFDGDQLRIGEFEIAVDISASDEDSPDDDGMRDSIVRAQLVPEDESVELQLVAEDKLTRDSTLKRHVAPATARPAPAARPAKKAATGNAAKATTPAPTPTPDPAPGEPEQRALTLFLKAAGIEPDAIAGHTAAEVLQGSGKLLRVMVSGLMELLRERSHMKDTFRLPQTVMQAVQNNPLKFSPTVDDALRYLLNDRGEGAYLSAEDAVRAGFRDVRQHEQALVKAMLQAVQDYVERFDPEELKSRFDKGLKRGGLLSGANKLKYWELYEESYPALTQRDDGGPPQLFSEEFARAYMQEFDGQKSARGR